MPIVGRGDDITAADLLVEWKALQVQDDVVEFYGDKQGDHRCFSNFFEELDVAFDFVVPEEVIAPGLGPLQRTVKCHFSEKAIMLCKAAAMGDKKAYEAIVVATSPKAVKAWGKKVAKFDEGLWTKIVCSVAFQVVYQKFSKIPSLKKVLLSTGDRLIAEATRNDKNWGIGLNVGDSRVKSPAAWDGSNILGWALMETRARLRLEQPDEPEADQGHPMETPTGPPDAKAPGKDESKSADPPFFYAVDSAARKYKTDEWKYRRMPRKAGWMPKWADKPNGPWWHGHWKEFEPHARVLDQGTQKRLGTRTPCSTMR